MNKCIIHVEADFSDEKRVSFGIKLPPEQIKLTPRQTSFILAGGLSMIIRCCRKFDVDESESQLMRDIIKYLNSEFSDINSFEDVQINDEYFKKNNNGKRK